MRDGQRAIKSSSKFPGKTTKEAVTYYMTSLKACAKKKDLHQGSRLHADIHNSGLLEKDTYLGNTLVSMYAKCGALVRAQQVVDGLPIRTVVSWTALIAGYVQHGKGKEALGCLHRMRSEGLSPNAITYACILKACGIMQDVEIGTQIHDEIVSQGLLEENVVLGNALVDMYAKCGVFTKAHKVLDELRMRDVVSWNALIAGYVHHAQGEEALDCFHCMKREGFYPDAITYTCTLKACGIIQDIDMGKQIHDEIASQGLLKKDVVLCGALVDMYAKCGVLLQARKVFDELSLRDAVCWNALIAGYIRQGQGKEALDCFQQMRSKGFSPSTITYICVLKACGIVQDVDKGKQIHDEVVSQGLLKKDIVLGNALIDMYARCGVLEKARQVLNELPVRDPVSWNALIAGLVQEERGEEALDCYYQMRNDGYSPDGVTFSCILKACGILQDVEVGKQIHDEIVSLGLLKRDDVLCGSLIDMYAKCGVLLKAQEVFDELSVRDAVSWGALIAGYAQQGQGQQAMVCFQRMRSEGFSPDVVTWTALIGGYAQQGLAKEALNCFQWMQREGISPDAVTFVNVLNACSHSGLVDEGQMFFDNMKEKYGIAQNNEHYTCMVDLFGRARLFDKAMRVIRMMPSSDHPPVWFALLGACRKWENVRLGRFAFERAVQLDQSDAAVYVLMSNIYAAAGMQEEAENIERIRIKNAAWKQPGRCCWVDATGVVHKFVVGDNKHPQTLQIYVKLQELELKLSQQGYSPDLHWVSRNVSAEFKKVLLCRHSEKLAIACAIINTPEGEDIHITKNMRVCGDCHAATLLISKIEKRKILVKDANRLHVFESGKCSCGGYL